VGTKNNPGDFDCYSAAEPDEPMFVLLARDWLASVAVRGWAIGYKGAHMDADGNLDERSNAKYFEALQCADDMDKWREENRNGS